MADQTFEQQLAAALAAAGGGLLGKSLSGGGNNNVPPQLGQLLDMSLQQNAYQNPLRQAVTQGAYGMLPTFMKEGTQLTGGLTNSIPAASAGFGGSGGGGGVSKAGVAGGAGLAALAGLLGKNGAGGTTNLSKLFEWIRNKFGHQVQGNKPYAGGALPSGNPDTFGGFTGWDNSGPPGRDANQWDPQPTPDVNTDQWMGQWPETTTPFEPFDPNQLSGSLNTGEIL